MLVATASAFNGEPSWKVTPSRNWNWIVLSSIRSHSIASRGMISPVEKSRVTSVSTTFRQPLQLVSAAANVASRDVIS